MFVRNAKIDELSGAWVTMDIAHHEIHDGCFFMYHDVVTLNDTGIQDYLITTGSESELTHIGHSIEATGPVTIEVYEATDKNAAGANEVTYNKNRTSPKDAQTIIAKGVAGGTTDGVRIVWFKGGISNNKTTNATIAGTQNEKILKPNTKYIYRITSGMDNNIISVALDWYENTIINLKQ